MNFLDISDRRKGLKTHPDTVGNMINPYGITVEILRKGGLGIRGTYANIDHHAHGMDDYVNVLAPAILKLNIKRWRQGHNVHVFETKDGRIFDMVPLVMMDEYSGIRLNLRVSRGTKVRIADLIDPDDAQEFIDMLTIVFAPPRKGVDVRGATCNDQ